MAAISGSLYKLQTSTDGGTTYIPVVLQTNCSIDITTSERTIITKDNCNWQDGVPTMSNYTVSGEALLDNTGHSFDALLAMVNTTFLWKLTPIDCDGVEVTGESEYSGSGYLTSLGLGAPDKDSATTSITINGTGELTTAPVPVVAAATKKAEK